MYTLSAQREPIRETKSRIEGYPTKRAACEASPKGTSERQVRTSPSEDERSLHLPPSQLEPTFRRRKLAVTSFKFLDKIQGKLSLVESVYKVSRTF